MQKNTKLNNAKATLRYVFYIALAVLFGMALAFFANKSASFNKTNNLASSYTAVEQTLQENTNTEKQNFYFIKDPNKKPKVSAETYLVGDLDTGEIILQKNKDKTFPIASVSKLMTATVSTDIQDQKELTQISNKALSTYGENGDFHLNEKIKIGDLIYPMILESSNDAAEAIAEASGRNNFIEKMNDKAKELGMIFTSFMDPSGLSEKNISTTSDLFKFAQYLKKEKPQILQESIKRNYSNKSHTWFNTSQFLSMDGYQGGKRGYIDESKQTALALFTLPLGQEGMRNIGISILRSDDRLKDVQNLVSYLKKNVYYGGEADADMAWVKQKEGILEEVEPNFVTLIFGGDIMLDRGVRNSIMKNFGGDYSAMFEKLDLIKKADIAFANLEGPISDKGKDRKNLYSFRMNPSVAPALNGAGFNVLSIANNHMGDWGQDAFVDTLSRLNENEIFYTGGGINSTETEKPVIIEKNGIKVGYLAFSDVGPNWLKATENKGGMLLASDPRFEEIISNASKQVDNLVVSFHFGDEYQTKHNRRQETLAHKAIDNGAKLVIGSHPHVIQDTEVYKNGFIAYSLGNLIFDQYFSENTMQGMLLEVKINKDGTMSTKKNIVKLNRVFQPEKVIVGKEEKIKFAK